VLQHQQATPCNEKNINGNNYWWQLQEHQQANNMKAKQATGADGQ